MTTKTAADAPVGLSITVILTALLSGAVKIGFITIAAIFLLSTPFAWLDYFLLLILLHFLLSVVFGLVEESRKQKRKATRSAFEQELERIARGRG